MVLHEIENIMNNIPDVENVVAFYDDGTVFQTTFDKGKVNIPKLGSDLASMISMFQNLQTGNDFKRYKKIVFDGLKVSLIIYKGGEQSNIAVFFKRELDDQEIKNLQIKNYIDQIQELIDIDRKKLLEKELEKKNNDLVVLEDQIAVLKNEITTLNGQKSDKEKANKKIEELEKELSIILQRKKKLEEEISKTTL